MEENTINELAALAKAEAEGTLEETQKTRLGELKAWQSAEVAAKTAAEEAAKAKKEIETLMAQKEHHRDKAVEAAEAAKKAEEAAKKAAEQGAGKSLDVEDYIDISASLEGLDQREKEYLAKQHKLTGQAIGEIRKSEDFGLWQSAYQAKVEKEKAAKPSTRQTETDTPKSFEEKLASASPQEKEKLLTEAGLWQDPRKSQRLDRIDLEHGKL